MAIAAQFMQFPAWVAWYAADPVKGIPRQLKYRVQVADVAEFCSKLFAEHQRENHRAKQIQEQLSRRALPAADDFEQRCRTVDRRQQQLGPRWGIDSDRPAGPNISPEEACMATLGLTREQFDALPKRKAVE